MFEPVVTKNNINLMSPELLILLISKIETYCAGWWWSINQEPHMITLSMGPGRNSPRADDVAFSLTKLGDHGFIMTHPTSDVIMPLLPGWVDNVFTKVDLYREHTARHTDLSKIQQVASYRYQTQDDLEKLRATYQLLLEAVTPIERHGYTFHQVHLGSCDLTVDCSLRCYDAAQQFVDVSHDYGDDAILAESLQGSLEELMDKLPKEGVRYDESGAF